MVGEGGKEEDLASENQRSYKSKRTNLQIVQSLETIDGRVRLGQDGELEGRDGLGLCGVVGQELWDGTWRGVVRRGGVSVSREESVEKRCRRREYQK